MSRIWTQWLRPKLHVRDGLIGLARLAGASRELHRSLAVVPLIVDKRCYGEAPARPAGGTGAVSEGSAGGLMIVIWQMHRR